MHYLDGKRVFASRGEEIFVSDDGGESWRPLVRLARRNRAWPTTSHRLLRRLFRSGVHHLVRQEDWLVILASGWVHRYHLKLGRLESGCAPIVGSRPLALATAGRALYYGEYRGNAERSPVRVMSSEDAGKTWRVAFEFRHVRHVHGVFSDPFSGDLWITTGDHDNESAIWVADPAFHRVEKVISGGQQARAVSLLFTQEHVYFGSDTPLERNFLYRFRRGDSRAEALKEVGDSVFYGCQTLEGMHFSTACEPSQINPARQAAVWSSADGLSWHRSAAFPKDRWHFKLFQYGQVRFPSGTTSNRLWMTPFATEGDQLTYTLSSARSVASS